jgi:hypothetical protein
MCASAFWKLPASEEPARIRERVEIKRPEGGAFLAILPAGRDRFAVHLQACG